MIGNYAVLYRHDVRALQPLNGWIVKESRYARSRLFRDAGVRQARLSAKQQTGKAKELGASPCGGLTAGGWSSQDRFLT